MGVKAGGEFFVGIFRIDMERFSSILSISIRLCVCFLFFWL